MAKISVATVNELANKQIPCLEDNKNYDSSDMRILIELTDVESMTGKTIETETEHTTVDIPSGLCATKRVLIKVYKTVPVANQLIQVEDN